MLALEQVGHVVAYPTGNQGVVDCTLDDATTQVKTHDLNIGNANMKHNIKGKRDQPYHEDDPIDQVAVACIVKSGADFWLLYSIIPKDKLVKEHVFSSNNHRGMVSLCLPLGEILGTWLVGKPCYGAGKSDWRSGALYGWRPPVKLEVTERLPLDYLETASENKVAAKPEKAPGEAKLDYLRTRRERALAEKAAAEAKAAALDAKREAERLANAQTGPSTVNNITINNNHLHLHGNPKKRLVDGSIKNFFLKK